ncbi:hypothetical protein BsWGS_22958 [Bradybaena similaris]
MCKTHNSVQASNFEHFTCLTHTTILTHKQCRSVRGFTAFRSSYLELACNATKLLSHGPFYNSVTTCSSTLDCCATHQYRPNLLCYPSVQTQLAVLPISTDPTCLSYVMFRHSY